MEKQRKLKVIILSTLIIGVLTISVAFSALSRTLNIGGVGKMDTAKWDVRFENLREAEVTRDAVEISKPSIMDDGGVVGDINVKLTKPKDEISYKVDIANNGTIDAEVNVMTIADLTDEQKKLIDFGVYYLGGSKITKYDLLEVGEKRTIIIKIRYKDDIIEFDLPSEPFEIKLSCQIEYVQSGAEMVITPNNALENVTSVLAEGNADYNVPFFNGNVSKNKIESITFVSTLKVPKDAQGVAWDASLNKDGSVVAWYTDLDSNNLYELYIGGNGKVYAPKNSSNLFRYFGRLKEINFNNNFDTSNVENMLNMFFDVSIATLDLSSFNTSNVTNMNGMFKFCSLLTSLDLSAFDTSNVTDMSNMFNDCYSLTNLDLSSFDTSNVTDMSYMFAKNVNYSSNLKTLNLSSFNTSKVTNMSYMFYCNDLLENLDLNMFDTSNVTDMSYMFAGYAGYGKALEMSLKRIDLSSFNTSNVTNMSGMFYYCSSLTSLDLSNFNTVNVTNMYEMFQACKSLTILNINNFNTVNVTNMYYMFQACKSLTSLDLSNFNTSNVTNMSGMFNNCSSLTSLDLSNFDTTNVTKMSSMFMDCDSLTSLDISGANFDNVTNYSAMFNSIPKGITIYVKDETAKAFIQARKSDANVIIGAPVAYKNDSLDYHFLFL